ncbi:MAG: carbohydrate-binding protein [Phycisphaerales bacterium]|nr:carbohydrate-binding protein [Phycisphaerales bacterium]
MNSNLIRQCTALTLLIPVSTVVGQDVQQLGAGSYQIGLPDGEVGPSRTDGIRVEPRVTSDFTGPIPTNTWWSSLIWERWPSDAFGQPMHAHPLSMQAQSHGLMLGHLTDTFATGVGYQHSLGAGTIALHVGIEGLNAPQVEVAHAGDWTVTPRWTDGTRQLEVTFGRGLPIVHASGSGGSLVVSIDQHQHSWSVIDSSDTDRILLIGDQVWGLFAPEESNWTQTEGTFTAANATDVWVGVLPDASTVAIDLFRASARRVLEDTSVQWVWNSVDRSVDVSCSFHTADPGQDVLTCLYRHQYLNLDPLTVLGTYQSPRGEMRLVQSPMVQMKFPMPPMLPLLPDTGGVDNTQVQADLDAAMAEPVSFPADTYWCGKAMGRRAQLALIADQLGDIEARDALLAQIREVLESWLTVDTDSDNSATNPLQAGSATASSGVQIQTVDGASGPAATGMGNGDWLRFADVTFPDGVPFRSMIRFASGSSSSGLVQVRLDDVTGPVVAEAALGNTGGWTNWSQMAMGLSNTQLLEGTHDVFITCSTNSGQDILTLDWFAFEYHDGVGDDRLFALDESWNTLIGYPDSYGSSSELNDHHFHWSYFIMAASTVARFDPDWAHADQWGGMIDLLIADAANHDRNENRFCFLRHFEPWVGYSYAAGHAGFAAGNNQESSSESMHFAAACVMWGEVTGRDPIRDMGLFLMAVESAAIEQYWFDVDEAVFPPEMAHEVAGIVWDSGADYATWWTDNPEEIHGINVLPVTGGSLYLGRRPEAMQRAWNELVAENGGDPVEWRDVLWCWRALFDPEAALAMLQADPEFSAEAGSSRAFTGHWIGALSSLGTIDVNVHGNAPLSAVFEQDGLRTYVAHNTGPVDQAVHFSDGVHLCVPAGETLWSSSGQACDATGDVTGDGAVDVSDLTTLLAQWGPCPNCAGDLDGDGVVTILDLLIVLSNWS